MAGQLHGRPILVGFLLLFIILLQCPTSLQQQQHQVEQQEYQTHGYEQEFVEPEYCNDTIVTELRASSGRLTSPNFPGVYPNNLCRYWRVTVPQDRVIRLDIHTMVLECCCDGLSVYDGYDKRSELLVRLCKGTSVFHYVTSGNTMFLEMITDSSVSSRGFDITWSVNSDQTTEAVHDVTEAEMVTDFEQLPVSGPSQEAAAKVEEISGVSGTVTSPGYPGSYPNSLSKSWRITVTYNQVIRLSFQQLSLEVCCDWLRVYDGYDASAPLLGSFYNLIGAPETLTSSTQHLYLQMWSDSSITSDGFSLSWSGVNEMQEMVTVGQQHFEEDDYGNDYGFTIQDQQVIEQDFGGSEFSAEEFSHCEGDVDVLTGTSGNVTSPNFPGLYPNNVCHYWRITVPEGHVILLDVQVMIIECCCDWLKIYDGPGKEYGLLRSLCNGTTPFQFMSSHNEVLLEMESDSSVPSRGFEINWEARPAFLGTESTPSGTQELTGRSGTVTSPGYPGNYPNDLLKSWRITVTENHIIRLRVNVMEMEICCDYVRIYDGFDETAKLLEQINQMPSPPFYVSSDNQVYLMMYADHSNTEKGFSITWMQGAGKDVTTAVTSEESDVIQLTGTSGTVTSPGYPEGYPGNLRKYWRITVAEYHVIRLDLTEIGMEACCDYLRIYDGYDDSAAILTELYHISDSRILTSSSNHLYLYMFTDSSYSFSGFSITWTEEMPTHGRTEAPAFGTTWASFQEGVSATYDVVQLTGSSGTITSPGYPGNYPNNVRMFWRITVSYNYVVRLAVDGLALEECCDSLRFYDGYDERAPLRATAHSIYGTFYFTSSTRYLYLYMFTDGSQTGPGFNMTWTEQVPRQRGTDSPDYGRTWAPSQEETSRGYESYTKDYGAEDVIEVTGTSGTLASQGYPEHYGHNLRIFWRITVAYNHVILLRFHRIRFEQCCDYLQIYDGYDSSADSLARLHQMPPDSELTSSSNQLYLEMGTDHSVANLGFNLTWIDAGERQARVSVVPIHDWTESAIDDTTHDSGGYTQGYRPKNVIEFTGTSGTFASPGYPDSYPPNLRIFWRITVAYNHVIEFYFEDISLEQCCDYLQIYDGYDTDAYPLARLYSMPSTMRLKSSSNHLFFEMDTDKTVNYHGFNLTWFDGGEKVFPTTEGYHKEVSEYPTQESPRCYVDSKSGSGGDVSSPGYGVQPYPNNLCKAWRITVPEDYVVHMVFREVALECGYDTLTIYDGYDETSSESYPICWMPPARKFTASGNTVYLKMTTDGSVSSAGFLLSWWSRLPRLPSNWPDTFSRYNCSGGEIQELGSSGTFEATASTNTSDYSQFRLFCWKISVDYGYVSRLKVDQMNMDQDETDIWLYDGLDPHAPLLGRLRGMRNSSSYITTSRYVLILMLTDKTDPQPRFHLEWQMIDHMTAHPDIFPEATTEPKYDHTSPSATHDIVQLTGSSGLVTSPGWPWNYPNNVGMFWRITVSYNYVVQLTLHHLRMESCCDFLRIYDGYDEQAPLIAKVHYIYDSQSFISSTRYLYIYMYTDGSNTGPAFNMTWTKEEPQSRGTDSPDYATDGPRYDHTSPSEDEISWTSSGSQCPELSEFGETAVRQFEASSGMLTSPCHPGHYVNNLNLHWRILLPNPEQVVVATFDVLEIECCCDHLILSDTYEDTAAGGLQVCQLEDLPHDHIYTSTRDYLYIKMKSDSSVSFSGFRMRWRAAPRPGRDYTWGPSYTESWDTNTEPRHDGDHTWAPSYTETVDHDTDSTIEQRGESGEATSPGFPGNYPNNLHQEWPLTVASNEVIRVTFHHLNTECRFDWVYLYDGTDDSSPLLGRFCHMPYYPPPMSSGNHMLVKMTSDGSNTRSGYHLTWHAVELVSGFRLVSPGYPGSYPHSLDKHWLITAPNNKIIRLTVHEISLEACCDELRIYDGVKISNSTLLAQLHHMPDDPVYQSSGNKVYLIMTTDGSVAGPGFHLTWTELWNDNQVTEDAPLIGINGNDDEAAHTRGYQDYSDSGNHVEEARTGGYQEYSDSGNNGGEARTGGYQEYSDSGNNVGEARTGGYQEYSDSGNHGGGYTDGQHVEQEHGGQQAVTYGDYDAITDINRGDK